MIATDSARLFLNFATEPGILQKHGADAGAAASAQTVASGNASTLDQSATHLMKWCVAHRFGPSANGGMAVGSDGLIENLEEYSGSVAKFVFDEFGIL